MKQEEERATFPKNRTLTMKKEKWKEEERRIGRDWKASSAGYSPLRVGRLTPVRVYALNIARLASIKRAVKYAFRAQRTVQRPRHARRIEPRYHPLATVATVAARPQQRSTKLTETCITFHISPLLDGKLDPIFAIE